MRGGFGDGRQGQWQGCREVCSDVQSFASGWSESVSILASGTSDAGPVDISWSEPLFAEVMSSVSMAYGESSGLISYKRRARSVSQMELVVAGVRWRCDWMQTCRGRRYGRAGYHEECSSVQGIRSMTAELIVIARRAQCWQKAVPGLEIGRPVRCEAQQQPMDSSHKEERGESKW